MKHTNFAKRALACGLAVAMVVTSGNIPSINVSAAQKSKAKLSKSKVSVIADSTTTLKVKKAKKKVKWSTSNKKIAKVTKTSGKKKETATVLGVKKGKAVITANVDGKKLKCKVTVKANKIKSASIDKLDHSAVTVKFTKKTSLNVGDVKVAVKEYQSGSYNASPKVEALSTKDQKTYRLYLTSEIALNNYVKITVGKYSKEIQNKQKFRALEDSVTVLLEKDVTVVLGDGSRDDQGDRDEIYNAYTQQMGNVSYSLKKGSKLPKGLSLVGKRGLIKGIPTVAGETKVTLIAKDEAGRKINIPVTFKVYDDTTVVARDYTDKEIKLDDYMVALNASKLATETPASSTASGAGVAAVGTVADASVTTTPVPVVTADPEKIYTTYEIKPRGGSGSYKYDLAQNTDGVTLSTDITDANQQVTKKADTSTELYIPYGLAAGTHTYTVTITDAADATRATTSTITVDVVENFNISGTVTDSAGTALSGNEKLYFYPSDAETEDDYEYGRTYEKYQKKGTKTSYAEDDDSSYYSYSYSLVDGNHQSAYDSSDSHTVTCRNGDKYYYYNLYETSQVGPYPVPTVLTSAPTTVAPAATQSTASAEDTAQAAATPAATPYKVADLAEGNYQAEVPAGTYTVKVKGHNGIMYQLDNTVTVSADAVGSTNLSMPVRFANITAKAKFANDKEIPNDRVYFETENTQYESNEDRLGFFSQTWTFSARTDYQGIFTVSVPAGTYKMYWIDENGDRQYFDNTLKVENDTNIDVGDLKLSISRYEVSGIFKVHGVDESGNEKDTPNTSATLYFYDSLGYVTTVKTQYDQQTVKDEANSLNGKFALLLAAGTYTVRYKWDENIDKTLVADNELHTLGQVQITNADVANLSFHFNPYKDGIATEFSQATVLNLEQETVVTSNGNNDVLVKFAIPAAAATGEALSYDVSVALNEDQTLPCSVKIYREPGEGDTRYVPQNSSGDSYKNPTSFNSEMTFDAVEGTYVMRLTPIESATNDQKIGNIKVKVSKHQEAYEKSATPLTLNTPATVVCAKNVTDDDLKYTAYVKLSVEANKTYELSYSTKTVGSGTIDVSVASSGGYVTGTNRPGISRGSGKYTFTPSATGDIYLELYTDSTISTSIDVTAAEVVNQ